MPDIVNADCVSWLTEQAQYGFRADAAITDPPYHIASIDVRFGKPNSARAQHGKDGAAHRLSKRFTGSNTDTGNVSFQSETWMAVQKVLNPGGRLAAFGSTRNWWKLAAAIDAAGFEIEDTLMWTYSQGQVFHRFRLKPGYEPILIARAPGRVLDLGIDQCRDEKCHWPTNLIADSDSRLFQCKKATTAERMFFCPICDQHISGLEKVLHRHNAPNDDHLSGHPSTKPVELMRWLVRLLSQPGDLVLDPFAGSGTTIAAAVMEGRNALGIELDSRHAESARKRLTSVVSLHKT